MKKAVFYARVSTSLQEEKGTIDSQKNELIKQIKTDGNILAKEYIDNGWSGGRLDRPALDELRRDLKTDAFDIVYFLDADRIARDVSYQNIIIAELLKFNKEIIIKGKNYINNPDNKFNLTVLGAVNEYEKTRILERFMRGRREKARRGAIVDNANMYGYKHFRKSDNKDGYYEIDIKQAEVVKFMFETYARTDVSLNGLVRLLENKGFKTSTGKSYWKSATVRGILRNTTYYGEHYFNKTEKVESHKEKERYAKSTKTRTQLKEQGEWIMVPVPPIIEQGLFVEVQNKLARNKKVKRAGGNKYQLSGMVKCGICSHIYSGTMWKGIKYYKCNHRDKRYNHINREEILDCKNRAVNGLYLENLIINALEKKILQPQVIKKYIDILQNTKVASKGKFIKRIEGLDNLINSGESKKVRVLDLYADNGLEKNQYMDKMAEIDKELTAYTIEKEELTNKMNLLDKKKEITASIGGICKKIKNNYNKLGAEGRKLIIQNLISEVILYKNEQQNKVIIRGFLPIEDKDAELQPTYCIGNGSGVNNSKVNTIEYEIEEELD